MGVLYRWIYLRLFRRSVLRPMDATLHRQVRGQPRRRFHQQLRRLACQPVGLCLDHLSCCGLPGSTARVIRIDHPPVSRTSIYRELKLCTLHVRRLQDLVMLTQLSQKLCISRNYLTFNEHKLEVTAIHIMTEVRPMRRG